MLLTAAFVMSIALAPAKASKPDTLIPPAVPVNLEAPPGHRPFMITSAQGTQNYICVPSPTGVAWSFLGPQATLFNDRTEQVLSHFLSPNPDENAMPRAKWQHS